MRVLNFPALACAMLALSISGAGMRDVAAQAWPAQPIRVIVPFAAGNVLDVMLRAMGERARELNGQAFVVDARPGAGVIVAAQALLASKADGYTVLLATQGMLAINPHNYRKLPYDPARDFALVSEVATSPMLLAELTRRIIATPQVAERVAQLGMGLVGSTPAEFTALTRAETDKWAGIVKASGFTAD